MTLNCSRVNIIAPTILDYQSIIRPNATKIGIVLHGYAQNSSIIMDSLQEVLKDEDYNWFVPNGVFPMPKQVAKEVKYRFAWYFYDSIQEKYFIDFTYPTFILSKFLEMNNPTGLPVTIIGYSQGGYLAPFLAQAVSQTKTVISINANYRYDMLEENKFDFNLWALHGDKDEVVDYNRSKNSYNHIKDKLNGGNFITINDGKHMIDDKYILELKKLIS